eukprot:SAG22_NODE_408_length_10942_cov_6.157429_6_plen_288_part_00
MIAGAAQVHPPPVWAVVCCAVLSCWRTRGSEAQLPTGPQLTSDTCTLLAEHRALNCDAEGGRSLCPVECGQPNATAGGAALTCSAVASHGRCATMSDFCPNECDSEAGAAAGGSDSVGDPNARDPNQISLRLICSAVASSGACNPTMSELCPAVCSGAGRPPPPLPLAPPPGQPIATSCATLIELDGGCAHDLSATDPAAALGTRVSDVCPGECSGHGGCAPTAADASFLGAARDSSGHDVGVELGGDACVDGAGVLLSGAGWVDLAIGNDYVSDGACTLSFWLCGV